MEKKLAPTSQMQRPLVPRAADLHVVWKTHMKTIHKIKLHNFKRFSEFEVELHDGINVFVGDNEAGKSSILLAIDLVITGSRTKVGALGLDSLFNKAAIDAFFSSSMKFVDLPKMYAELYLTEQKNPDLNGKNNSDETLCDGLALLCEPDLDYGLAIKRILSERTQSFPFEYYKTRFITFQGDGFTNYKKYINHLLLDSTHINNAYATNDYIKRVYNSNTDDAERNKLQFEYRNQKEGFKNTVLSELNSKLSDYTFTLKTGSKETLEADLTISDNGVSIEHQGKGRQCFIKTDFALKRHKSKKELDLILLEEPENHLSHIQMRKLINRIQGVAEKQVMIATHSNLISSRLNLRKAVLLNSKSTAPVQLDKIPKSTAEFFIKGPDTNILEFILAGRVLLVEGNAEYILFDALHNRAMGKNLDDTDIHIISVGGTSFKRYLDIAKILGTKVAVVRDNDGNYKETCVNSFTDYASENIKIFFDSNNARTTFEICIYEDNSATCDQLFGTVRKSLSVQDYMLKNKTEAAFALRMNASDKLAVPTYIEDAFKWINE